MQLLCGQCGRTMSVEDDLGGQQVTCANCGHKIRVPDFGGPAQEPGSYATRDAQEEGFADAAREMMARKLLIVCGSCGKNLKTSRKLIGRKVRCPSCKAKIRVPSPDKLDQAVLTVRAQDGTRAADVLEEDLAGLPTAKLVRPPLPAWFYFVVAAVVGGAIGAILLSLFF